MIFSCCPDAWPTGAILYVDGKPHHVPEALNVYKNEIDKELTAIKLNKLKFNKLFKKITFFSL